MIMASLTETSLLAAQKAVAIPACPIHAAAICRMIGYWADQGLTIRRDLRSIVTSIDDFVVAVYRQRVVGCGSLCAVGDQPGVIGEIRSIAVDPGAVRVGAGRAVMDALFDLARVRSMERVVLLTKTPGFFERFGYERVEPTLLPEPYLRLINETPGRTLDGKVAMGRLVLSLVPA